VIAGCRALIAVIVLVVVCPAAGAATRYDPRLRFRTLTTPHFTIYFHQQEDALARRLAAIAEDVADRVAGELGQPNGRVHVILVNQHDVSNGWATPVPYNTIEISAAAPTGASQIGNTDDWLRLVLSHEYTHIVHLDKARGWIGGLRYVFGHAPLLYPNLFLPLWQVEGIATYNESVLTGEGRIPAGDFRLIVDRAALSHRFDPIDRANGGLVDWPGGSAQYVYGGYFHQYLADRFGAASIAKLADETSGRVPYFGAPAFRKLFHRSLGDLWNDFEAEVRDHAGEEANVATRLTHHGFSVGPPTFGQNAIFYSIANPHGFPALMALKPGQANPREVTTRYLGSQIGARGGLLVFDQLELVRNAALQSDLYTVSENGARVQRITHLARAADPDLAPNGRTVVCTIQLADRRALATLQLPSPGSYAQPSILVSETATDFSSPRWSPDGRSIAVERRRLGGPSEIVVVDAGNGRIRAIATSRDGRNVTPSWLSPSVVLFASDRGGRPFNIYSVNIVNGAVRRLTGAGPSAQSPVVSPDGATVVFVGYTADGYDLFSLPLASATWSEVESPPRVSAAEVALPSPENVPAAAAGAYRPWRTLAPRYWMPIVESDAGEVLFGAESSGNDVLGRHGYGGSVAWSASRLHPDWSFTYTYDRWWPILFASVSDDTDPWRGGDIQTREVNAGALFTVARIRWSVNLLAAINASDDRFSCDGCDPPAPPNVKRGAIRMGWSADNAKSYGYSISRESGGAVRLTWESAPEAFGSDATNSSMTFDARGYQRVGPAHAVVAGRAGTAFTWGDQNARRIFSASGPGPASSGFDFGRGAIGLLRGFDSDTIVGTRAAVANLDYRFPLWRVQRGVGTIPMFIRTIHGAVFTDAGNAWDDAFRWNDVRLSTGVELSLDTVLGFGLPLSFATGVAWRHDPVGTQDGVAVFGRIGRAF
jgi:hypothetical protein